MVFSWRTEAEDHERWPNEEKVVNNCICYFFFSIVSKSLTRSSGMEEGVILVHNSRANSKATNYGREGMVVA